MGTSRAEISDWFDKGKAEGATHMIVVCDGWDYVDFPVYVKPDQKVREVYEENNGKNMLRVMEVYSLNKDKALQMSEHRAFHFD